MGVRESGNGKRDATKKILLVRDNACGPPCGRGGRVGGRGLYQELMTTTATKDETTNIPNPAANNRASALSVECKYAHASCFKSSCFFGALKSASVPACPRVSQISSATG